MSHDENEWPPSEDVAMHLRCLQDNVKRIEGELVASRRRASEFEAAVSSGHRGLVCTLMDIPERPEPVPDAPPDAPMGRDLDPGEVRQVAALNKLPPLDAPLDEKRQAAVDAAVQRTQGALARVARGEAP